MTLQVIRTSLPEVFLVQPAVFKDERGFFMESYNQAAFEQATGVTARFVQDNHSSSGHGVLRGLHYQSRQPQGKLVRVLQGRIFSVAVDLRRSSPRLGRWVGTELDAAGARQLWIPPGFAHGFLVLSDSADVIYKTTEYRAEGFECAIAWNDPELGIDWPLHELKSAPRLSARDAQAPGWGQAQLFENM
jgi:dTDP-4-dehydrorhamnose 3,5-epimerase